MFIETQVACIISIVYPYPRASSRIIHHNVHRNSSRLHPLNRLPLSTPSEASGASRARHPREDTFMHRRTRQMQDQSINQSIVNHHQSWSIILNHHQPTSILITVVIIFIISLSLSQPLRASSRIIHHNVHWNSSRLHHHFNRLPLSKGIIPHHPS